MSQPRIGSLAESMVNVSIGYVIAIASQKAIFPLFGIGITMSDHLLIGAMFTVVSIARTYCVRRLFNAVDHENLESKS